MIFRVYRKQFLYFYLVVSQLRPFTNTIYYIYLLPHLWTYAVLCLLDGVHATFNNISAISWRSVLLVQETGGPGENHRPAACHWQTLCCTYTSPWSRFELTTSVLISTDCIGSCKSNYHAITVSKNYKFWQNNIGHPFGPSSTSDLSACDESFI